MKLYFQLIICLVTFHGLLIANEKSSSDIMIHYGLNDSHSKSWV